MTGAEVTITLRRLKLTRLCWVYWFTMGQWVYVVVIVGQRAFHVTLPKVDRKRVIDA